MQPRVPRPLRPGDEVRVIAPARSRAMVLEHDERPRIEGRFAELGLTVSYGAHVDECDDFVSAPIDVRVADLHDAFADPSIAAVLTVIGGYNSNELLPHLDWDLIAAHPKVFCGYSDITALHNAIFAKTGLVTYSGPHWSSFGMRDHFEQTLDWFRAALFGTAAIELIPSAEWTDDLWFLDQDAREPQPSAGWWPLQQGTASGRILGTNLCTLNLLQGTEYMPALNGALLMLEDDLESHVETFARDLTSLLQLPDAKGITGLVIGRFQRESAVTREALAQVVARQPALAGLPVLANADFGHTFPLATVPIGGSAHLDVGADSRLTVRPI